MKRFISILFALLLLCGCFPEQPYDLLPTENSTYSVGSPARYWSNGYFGNLVVDNLTLAGIPVGGDNVTGAGTVGKMAKWTAADKIGNAINTDTEVASAVTLKHTQGTDTTLGTQTADLNMGTKAITNVGTVDGVDVSAHASRHDSTLVGGSDSLYMVNLATFDRKDTYETMPNTAQFGNTLTGGRGSVNLYYSEIWCDTGNQANDISATGCWTPFYINYGYNNYCLRGYSHFQVNITTNKAESWVGVFAGPTTFPTTSSNHVGFKLIETAGAGDFKATLYASNGDGSNGTETAIATNVGSAMGIWCGFIYGLSDIKYYLSTDPSLPMVLVATHTTNRPTNIGVYPGVFIKTTEAVVKELVMWNWRWTGGQ
jgi:hypothetical protein